MKNGSYRMELATNFLVLEYLLIVSLKLRLAAAITLAQTETSKYYRVMVQTQHFVPAYGWRFSRLQRNVTSENLAVTIFFRGTPGARHNSLDYKHSFRRCFHGFCGTLLALIQGNEKSSSRPIDKNS